MWVTIRISLKSLMFYKDTKEGQLKKQLKPETVGDLANFRS